MNSVRNISIQKWEEQMPLLIHAYKSKHKGKRGKYLPALSLQMFFKEEACLSASHRDSYLYDPHRLDEICTWWSAAGLS